MIQGPFRRDEERLFLNECIVNGCWNFNNISFALLRDILDALVQTYIPVRGRPDAPISFFDVNDKFDTKLAYDLCTISGGTEVDLSWVWKILTLLKTQFFLWLTWND